MKGPIIGEKVGLTLLDVNYDERDKTTAFLENKEPGPMADLGSTKSALWMEPGPIWYWPRISVKSLDHGNLLGRLLY
ncbi:hypothetical protein MTR_4g105230 [Medicago truncatula]|uniref:Uncharacterized protein n=1 Tax=Medicago truncatula TaxID=3880 RepID=A0A072URW9_MEDTR|nr:hypothetical protein MTR_4g105230 [Medicago truncatula]